MISVDAHFLNVCRLFIALKPYPQRPHATPTNAQDSSLSAALRIPSLHRRVAEQERHTFAIMRPSTRLRQPVRSIN